jgi:hypothetical protein
MINIIFGPLWVAVQMTNTGSYTITLLPLLVDGTWYDQDQLLCLLSGVLLRPW